MGMSECLRCGEDESRLQDGYCWRCVADLAPVAAAVSAHLERLTTSPAALERFIAKAEPVGDGSDGRCGGCGQWRPIVAVGMCKACDRELDQPDREEF
jgi:NMD protein affecting ribosome stability and mRNA decay